MKLWRYALLLAALAPTMAHADLLPGQWHAQFYQEGPNGVPGFTGGVCVQADGTWYMTTAYASVGHWSMTGPYLHIHGGNTNFNGTGELMQVHPKLLAGRWQAWTDDHTLDAYFTSRWRYVSKNCDPAAPEDPNAPLNP